MKTTADPAGDRWRAYLTDWTIPAELLDRAPESPFRIPPTLFRPDHQSCSDHSLAIARSAIPPNGSVLDVGCGGGTASVPLAPPAALLTGVDTNPDMLEAFGTRCTEQRIQHRLVQGAWPVVAADVPRFDVVVCHHVAYNVQDIEDFLIALTQHASQRVVMEVSEQHPQAELNPLWLNFHGVTRPTRPTWEDLLAVVVALGLDVHVIKTVRPKPPVGQPREDLVAFARRRLCLDATWDDAIDKALAADASVPPSASVCLWWDSSPLDEGPTVQS